MPEWHEFRLGVLRACQSGMNSGWDFAFMPEGHEVKLNIRKGYFKTYL